MTLLEHSVITEKLSGVKSDSVDAGVRGGNSNEQEITVINFIAYRIVVFIVAYSSMRTALDIRG